MKELRKRLISASGFTLIELLLVIVIIGILAGVLIGVINPAAQQNKARDAGVRATINKVALATSGFVSAYGRIPNNAEFLGNLTSVTARTCAAGTAAACTFEIASNALPSLTTAGCTSEFAGSGVGQCYYLYCGGDDGGATNIPVLGNCIADVTSGTPLPSQYKLVARAFGGLNVFMYRSTDSKMYTCTAAGASCTPLYN